MKGPFSSSEPIVLFDSSKFVATEYSPEPLVVSMSEGIIGRALPGTGAISMNDVNFELERASPYNQQVSFNDAEVRSLFRKPTGAISMLDGRNKYTIDLLVVGGGGGSGIGGTARTNPGGAGGSGTVRFRYVGSPRHTSTANYTVSESGGYTYITCNVVGSFNFTA